MSRLRAACTTAVATAAATVLAAVPSTAAPEPGGVAALLTQLKSLYQQSEAAGEAYNASAQALARQRAQTARAGGGLADARAALERERAAAGAIAR
ncbi:hypothetical protein L1885_25105, partial [Streptomyces fuscigenes]|nr:hypothetical protein [Streptomyces fuscigenes]